MERKKRVSLFLLALAASPAAADDFIIDAPRIAAGERTLEADYTYYAGHGRDENGYFGQHYAVNYAVSEQWETSFLGEFENEPGNAPYASHIEWQNIFVPFRPGTWWLDVGGEIEIDQSTKAQVPSVVQTKLLLEKDFGKVSNVANIVFDRSYGPHAESGLDTGLLWITSYSFRDEFSLGVQYSNDLGVLDRTGSFNSQEHVLGPVAQGEIGKLSYITGVLFGLTSNSPGAVLRLDMEYGF